MNKVDIGLRLAELRGYTGFTRKSLSEIANIPAVTIKAWEEGKTEIGPHTLAKYLKELATIGVSTTMDWVMYGQDPTFTIFLK